MVAPTGNLLVLQQSADAAESLNFLHGYGVGEGSPLPQKDQISHSREAKRLPYKGFFAFCDSPSMPSRPWRFHKVSLHLNEPLPLGEVAA